MGRNGQGAYDISDAIEASKRVIEQCSLENGAIVAANATKDYYPSSAKNYFYVWPRDAAYACVAADLSGMNKVQESFFSWCLERAEGFRETGLFCEKYYVNGLKALSRFQPDQTGTILYALWHHHHHADSRTALRFEDLIVRSANGLCESWDSDHFRRVTNDLWEERLAFPDLKENFTYSLAACIRGLECAGRIMADNRWSKVAGQMRDRLERHFVDGCFVRSYGRLIDRGIDASMLGLVYPFGIYEADDERILSTVKMIEDRLVINGGVRRYERDDYDGWMYEEMHRRKGGGAWPLLNFWMSIYYSLKGDREKAEAYYHWVLHAISARQENSEAEKGIFHLPEQIFDNDLQISVSPLMWSHVMFIIASRFLGYL